MRSFMARRRRAAGKRADAGMTMVAVLASCVILVTVVLGSAAFLSSSTKFSRYEQDSDLALAAAQSGMNDLLAQLRADSNYLDTVAADHVDAVGYCHSGATGGPADIEGDYFKDVCGWTNGTGVAWKPLGGVAGRQYYHYVVTDYDPITSTVDAVSTGKSGTVVRSLRARLAPESTPMYMYFSDYELADPTDPTTYPPNHSYQDPKRTSDACGGYPGSGSENTDLKYAWEAEVGDRRYAFDGLVRDCYEPEFNGWGDGRDSLDGWFHSNDTVRSDGAVFGGGSWTTADPKCSAEGTCVNGSATWLATHPISVAKKPFGGTGSAEAATADGTLGCRYAGPTRIILEGDEMVVWSKGTTTSPDRCGTPTDLKSADGARVTLPDDASEALVYVSASAANHRLLQAGEIGGPDGRELPLGNYTTDLVATQGATFKTERAMVESDKYAEVGNVWVEGSASRTLTIAAEGSIIITGDLLTTKDDTTLLGLLAGGAVELYNPVVDLYGTTARDVECDDLDNCHATNWEWDTETPVSKGTAPEAGWPTDYNGDTTVFEIEAAIHASSWSFRLQNWRTGGALGLLKVHGSIAQKFRGVVAMEDEIGALVSGYKKDWSYNETLTRARPLLFPALGSGDWLVPWVEKAEPNEAVKS